MSRKHSRELALVLINSYCFDSAVDSAIKDMLGNDGLANFSDLEEFKEVTPDDKSFAGKLYNGVVENFEELKAGIKASVKDFSVSQIFKLDMSILLLAVYEIKNDVSPVAVVINEAVELAKKFSTAKSPSFINAVLSSFAKTHTGK